MYARSWTLGALFAALMSCDTAPVSTSSAPSDRGRERPRTVFPGWQAYAVRQRNPQTGCIPAGYEMLLRAAGVTTVDFTTFQEDFDLGKRNNFASVAAAVRNRYPDIRFVQRNFENGMEKLKFIEERIAKKQPTLVSIALQGLNPELAGWHIMAVVDADEEHLFLLNGIREDGQPDVQELAKSELVRIHENYVGGSDVAFLDR